MKTAETPWQIAWGLMFKKNPEETLFHMPYSRRWKFHTWFCRTPLDIYFLNNGGCVVDYYLNVQPFKLVQSKEPALYVLEVPKSNLSTSRQ